MGEMVRYGVLPNPHTPGVLVDFYGHPISSGGGGYASLTGAGQTVTPGDLAQAGGLTVTAPSDSTEGINLTNHSTVQSFNITDDGGNGLVIRTQGGGVLIEDTVDGGISIDGNSGGVGISAVNASDILLNVTGSGRIALNSETDVRIAGAPVWLNGEGTLVANTVGSTPANPPAGTMKLYFKSDDNLYALDPAGTEVLIGGTQVLTAGSLGSNVPVAGGPTVFLSTGTLQPGTYLITLGALIGFPVVNGCDIWATQGTATATLSGQIAGSFQTEATAAGGGNIGTAECSLAFKAVVTVAGALAFNADEGGSTAVILADTFEHVQAGATGYTALKIA